MNTYREQLIDRLIAVFGYEDKKVIEFAEQCERLPNDPFNDSKLLSIVKNVEMTQKRR